MIEVKGKPSDIAQAIRGISDKYPVDLIEHLTVGEWFFIVNGVTVRVLIEEGE